MMATQPMALNFHRNADGYSAIAGHWPSQRRFVIYRSGPEWRLSQQRHVPGKGFVEVVNTDHRTLTDAKDRANAVAAQ
jgi:hypothetical protein